MALREIVLETTEPETEWVRGRALQKVSPTYRHSLVQRRIATALGAWADGGGHGRVATEWRFRVKPPGEAARPLVPDVAFVSYATLAIDAPGDTVDVPRSAPTVAFEVLSPKDRLRDVRDKIHTYLAAGSRAVIVVDPKLRRAVAYDQEGAHAANDATLAHPALPGFVLTLAPLFAGL